MTFRQESVKNSKYYHQFSSTKSHGQPIIPSPDHQSPLGSCPEPSSLGGSIRRDEQSLERRAKNPFIEKALILPQLSQLSLIHI